MMKKITLLLFAFIAFSVKAQILFLDDMSTDQSSSYTIIDGDGSTIASYLTDQGVFTNGSWTLANFGPPAGTGYYTTSFFVGADTCTAAKDFLILPELDFTTATSSPKIIISSVVSLGAGTVSAGVIKVYATATIAGASPVASDFSGAALASFNLTGTVVDYVADLSSMSGNASVYIAIVSEGSGCADIVGINKIKVLNTPAKDLAVTASSILANSLINGDLAFPYSVMACDAGLTPVDITLKNEGTSAIADTVYVAYVYQDGSGNEIYVEDEILAFTTSPLAPGATYVHTFSDGIDVAGFEVTVISVIGFVDGDQDSDNDELVHILVAPNATDLSASSYINSFEMDFNDDAALAKTLAMQFVKNSAFSEYAIEDYSIYTNAADFVTDGNNILVHNYVGDDSSYPGSNNFAFTSCMSFQTGKSYRVSFDYTTFSGSAAPHKLNFGLATSPNSGSIVQTVLTNVNFAAEELTAYSGVFTVTAASGNYYFSINDKSTIGYFMMIDMLTIEEIQPPATPSVNVTWNACASEATLVFNYSSNNTYTLDWGDGSPVQTVTSSPVKHTYVGGTYVATVTATNVAGTATTTANVNATALPAPTANFTIGQSGTADNSVDFNIVGSALPCFTYSWIFGDGAIGSGATASHVYTANGTFDVVLLVESTPTGESATMTKQVTVTGIGIQTIAFVNGINVYPNPATEFVNVSFELNNAQDVQISLVSIDGKVVNATSFANVSNVNTSLNTSNLSKGMYILNVTTNEGKFTRNLIVR